MPMRVGDRPVVIVLAFTDIVIAAFFYRFFDRGRDTAYSSRSENKIHAFDLFEKRFAL